MQKQSMFKSFLKKKQLIAQMITDTKSLTNKDQFKHFEAVSEPVYIKAETNAIYLTHLNNQFKDHLREFVIFLQSKVHEQQGFSQTMFQLAKITQAIEAEMNQQQNQYRCLRDTLNQAELDKAVLTDKNDFHLDKIISLQQQAKTLELMSQEHQKTATQLEEQIQYQQCVLAQIRSRNGQILSSLQIKTVQIQQATTKMQSTQKSIRQKESSIKKINQSIKDIYYTLEAQDDSLTNLCTAIQDGLNQQNNRISDIEFAKNNLASVINQTRKRKAQLQKAEETQDVLLNYEDDLGFELRRVSKQLQIQERGIDDQHWRIEQERQRLQENQLMLVDLQNYLKNLMHKNDLLEQSLQQQIIQDHTIKKIVDSKTQQPVGKKTKMFLLQFENQNNSYNKGLHNEKQDFRETASSWKENSTQSGYPQKLPLSNAVSVMTLKQRRELVERQVNKLMRKGAQEQEMEKLNLSVLRNTGICEVDCEYD